MPLIMGDWKLFINNKQLTMEFSDIDNRGHFVCKIDGLSEGVTGHQGEGFWNELAEQLSLFTYAVIPGGGGDNLTRINYFFNGYQIEGVSADDSASDKLWTLAGSYQVSVFGAFIENLPKSLGLLVQDSRRQALGWYAQKTEIR